MFLGIINESAFSVYSHGWLYERATVGDFQHIAEQAAAFPLLFPKLYSYAK